MSIKSIIRAVSTARYRGMYVILDPNTDSVTVSKALYRHMNIDRRVCFHIFCFRVRENFAFCFREDNKQLCNSDTAFSELSVDTKHNRIGFVMVAPTVNKVLYDYGLPCDKPVRLSVFPVKKHGLLYYKLQRPSANQTE